MSDIIYGHPLRIAEVKADDQGMEVAGYVSTFGNRDHGGDVVVAGAFTETLSSGLPVRFLFQHKTDQVLGKPLELRADEKGLFGRFKISSTQLGRDVHTLLKDGALDSFSIGYIPSQVDFDEKGLRLLKTLDLLECSVVAMPMNEGATVTAVKSTTPAVATELKLDDDCSFEQLLAQVSNHVNIATEAAEALQQRRAEGERKLSAAHRSAITKLLDVLGSAADRFELVASPPPDDDGLKTRLALANALRRGERFLETG